MTQDTRMLVPGKTCWRIERANRLALVVDAADYFRLAKMAMLKAQHSIMLIGWDFDTRIKLEPGKQTLEGPNRLGEFLSWLPQRSPDLHLYLLKWDLGMVQALGRGMMPVFIMDWMTSRRLRFKLDGAHPVGGAHHQKILVIDDALAFCGGIDMTVYRWDTRDHLDIEPRRTKPNGRDYGPWHDATTMVDGAVARALGDLARERWRRATGETLKPAPEGLDAWPDELDPSMRSLDVAIARSLPEMDEQDEIREIEALYLTAIARARRTIYIESQYLASRKLAEAFAERLREADSPEIVIVLPKTTEGWLEHKAMDGARLRLLHMLWRADVNQRLAVYYPVTQGGEPIYVHAKVMIVDDMLLRVGSSNMNNRSMGFDTECDLAVEAGDDSAAHDKIRKTIRAIRHDLLAEHLGVACDHLVRTEEAAGSLIQTVESLRSAGRTLIRFEPSEMADDESVLAENELLDPERPPLRLGERLSTNVASLAGNLGLRRLKGK